VFAREVSRRERASCARPHSAAWLAHWPVPRRAPKRVELLPGPGRKRRANASPANPIDAPNAARRSRRPGAMRCTALSAARPLTAGKRRSSSAAQIAGSTPIESNGRDVGCAALRSRHGRDCGVRRTAHLGQVSRAVLTMGSVPRRACEGCTAPASWLVSMSSGLAVHPDQLPCMERAKGSMSRCARGAPPRQPGRVVNTSWGVHPDRAYSVVRADGSISCVRGGCTRVTITAQICGSTSFRVLMRQNDNSCV
jgi:hypothetical protein